MAMAWFGSDTWVLTARQLHKARKLGLIDRLPDVTQEEISDRDKADWLVKGLALLHIVWLAVGVIARTSSNMASAPLEIMTLSFAVTAIFIYIFLFNHPKDINTRIYIPANRSPSTKDMRRILGSESYSFWIRNHPNDAIPNTRITSAFREIIFNQATMLVYAICFGLCSMISGVINIQITWDFIFPSRAEQVLFTISSLVAIIWPYTVLFLLSMMYPCTRSDRIRSFLIRFGFCELAHKRSGVALGILMVFVPLIPTRLLLIIEAVRSLYYLPPDAYYTTRAHNTSRIG